MEGDAAEEPDQPFYMECGCWPYVHSIVPMALIGLEIYPTENQTIILLAAYVSIYGWESLEKLSSFLGNSYLAESAYDSLLGDVAVGGLAITNLWLVDQITGWSHHIGLVVPYWLRLVIFFVIAAPSLVMGRFKNEEGFRLRYAAIGYGVYYVLVAGALFYTGAALAADAHPVEAHHVVLRTTVWIGIVAALTAIAAVIERRSSTILQVLAFEATLFLVLILILSIRAADPSMN